MSAAGREVQLFEDDRKVCTEDALWSTSLNTGWRSFLDDDDFGKRRALQLTRKSRSTQHGQLPQRYRNAPKCTLKNTITNNTYLHYHFDRVFSIPRATSAVAMEWNIAALEKQHQPLFDTLDLPPNTTYSLTAYETTKSRNELHDRIRDAHIVITTTVKLDAETLSHDVTPSLRYVIVAATGVDPIDLQACKSRAVRVCNCPGANLEAVSEHAISLYFAARRRTVLLDQVTRRHPSEWKQNGSVNTYLRLPDGKPPLTCGDEVLGIVGFGGLGACC